MVKGFVYRGENRTVDDVRRRVNEARGGNFDSYVDPAVLIWKPKEGENRLRVLPGTWDDVEKYGNNWEIGVNLHYDIGPEAATYLCLQMRNEECPICNASLRSTDADERKKLKPQYRALAWIIDRDAQRDGPQVWSLPRTLFKEVNDRAIDKRSNALLPFDHPDKGYDLNMNRAGTKLRTKYTAVEFDRDPSPLSTKPERYDQWMEYIMAHPLPSILHYYPADYLEAVLYGKVERRGGDDDYDDRRPLVSSRRDDDDDDRRGNRRRDDDDDRRGSRRDDDEIDERAARSRRRVDEDDAPPRRRPVDDEVDERSSRRRPADEDDAPPRRRPADDDDAPPRRRPADDDDDRRRPRGYDDDDAPPRRRAVDDDDAPPRRRPADDDDAPPRRRPADDDDAPRRRPADDADDAPPRRRAADDDDAPPRRRVADDAVGDASQSAKDQLDSLRGRRGG